MSTDRARRTPTLVRLYCRLGGYHRVDEFQRGLIPPDDELLVHTWPDATLGELAGLIGDAWEAGVKSKEGSKFAFRLLHLNGRGEWHTREMGQVYWGRRTKDDGRRLLEMDFEAGDLIDVAIIMPTAGIKPI